MSRTYLEGSPVLVVEDDPTHGLLFVLTVLEGFIHDDGEVVARSLLALETVDVVLLDEKNALFATYEKDVINPSASESITWEACVHNTYLDLYW